MGFFRTHGLDNVPDASLPEISDPGTSSTAPLAPEEPAQSIAEQQAPVIRVTTDVLDIEISTQGGTLQKAVLLRYPVAKDQPDTLVELLSTRPGETGLIESGVRATGGAAEATHLAMFSSSRASYELDGRDEIVVPLTWSDGSGIVIEKRYRFRKGSYAIGLEQQVKNGTETLWSGAEYVRLKRHFKGQERSMFDVDSYSFAGPIIYNGEKSDKLKHDDLVEDGRVEFYAKQGWFGSIQHHFLSAVVPQPGIEHRYEVAVVGDVSVSSTIGRSAEAVAPGSSKTFETTLFVGPKLQSQLEEIDKTLKLTVDYGWLTIISQPLFWLLSKVHTFVGNWGVSIILVTLLIKLAFYKLTESSGRSMAKMRNLQPRMKALQDRYKDDRQALSQAMMELYKREKVNPAAGCLPILIQMPAPADPVQAKVMQIMPVMFTVFFAFFPSGLVLYWVTNTLLSIAQQWKINTVVEAEAKAQKSSKKKKKDD